MPKPLPDQQMAERLRQARVVDGRYTYAADAARAMGIPAGTYLGHENGSRGFQASAGRYADFYKINLEWLLTGRGSMARNGETAPPLGAETNPPNSSLTESEINLHTMVRDMPILGGAICGEDGLFELNGQVLDYALRPPRLVGVKDAYGVYVNGESMSPWREPGEIVYVLPHMPVKIGDYVVVQLHNEKPGNAPAAYIKRLVRRTASTLHLLQYNPREEISLPMKRVKTIHRVISWSELLS